MIVPVRSDRSSPALDLAIVGKKTDYGSYSALYRSALGQVGPRTGYYVILHMGGVRQGVFIE